jgi:hypothetical protein
MSLLPTAPKELGLQVLNTMRGMLLIVKINTCTIGSSYPIMKAKGFHQAKQIKDREHGICTTRR